MTMLEVRYYRFLRSLARMVPLKYKLNVLIRRYLRAEGPLLIPYHDNFSIIIQPGPSNRRTISDLIFEGPGYLPEFSLVRGLIAGLRPGFVYVDVGANIGTTIWLFASKASKVIAFEPIPHLFNTIQTSKAVNKATNVDLRQLAIGDKEGTVRMVDNDNSNIVADANWDGLEIQISTLDKQLAHTPAIDLIKIDVEGFEFRVLVGARKILTDLRPSLLIEVHPGFLKQYGDSLEELLFLLDGYGYKTTYYSFLNAQRFGRLKRLLARYGKGVFKFNGREDFLMDVLSKPELMSYHLYCTPSK